MELLLVCTLPFPLVSLILMYPCDHQSPQIVTPVYYERDVYGNLWIRKPKELVLKRDEKQKQTVSLLP